jgi:hypothetical protein
MKEKAERRIAIHVFLFRLHLVVLFGVFTYLPMRAQNYNVSGYVSLEDLDDNKEGIITRLLDITGLTLIQFKTTDNKGYFQFQNIRKGNYKLHIAQFAHQDTTLAITVEETEVVINQIILKRLSLSLEGITIVDKAILMKKSGDTTIFNLKVLETGSEQSVTDIAMKIPGLSVNGNQYFFQNKPIEKLLIDGKDISDGQQIEFTDAIQYKTVEDLRIIENYSSSYQPYGEKQDRGIAMDIKLKTKYRKSRQGIVLVMGGYEKIYDAGTSFIQTKKKSAFRLQVKSNSTGKNLNDTDISTLIETVENDQLFKGRHQLLYQIFPIENVSTNATQFYTLFDHQVKAGLDSKINEKYQFKSNFTFHGLSSNQDITSTRLFFSEDSPIQISQRSNFQHSWSINGDNNIAIKYNQSTHLEINIPTYLSNENQDAFEIGRLQSNEYVNENKYSLQSIQISPIYKFHKKWTNDLTLSIFGVNKYTKKTGNLFLFGQDSIPGYSYLEASNNLFYIDQASMYSTGNFNNQIRLGKKIKNLNLQYNFLAEKNVEHLSNSSKYIVDEPFSGVENLSFLNFTNSLKVMYDKRPFRLSLGLIQAHSLLKTYQEQIKNNFVRPNILLMYRISPKWNVSTTYATKIMQPSLIQTNHLQTLRDQFSLWEGGANLKDVGMIETYTLSLFRDFEIGEEATFLNASISYIPKSTEVHPVYELDYFQVKSYQLLNKSNQMRLQLYFNKKSRLWNLNFNVLASQSNLLIDGDALRDHSIIGKMGFSFYRFKHIRLISSIDMRLSSTENATTNAVNLYLRPRISVGFDKGMLQGRVWYQFMYNETRASNNTYHSLNVEFERKKVLKYFQLNLKLYDLLNLSPKVIESTTFNPFYVQTDSYVNIRGQILIGLKWYFSPEPIMDREDKKN